MRYSIKTKTIKPLDHINYLISSLFFQSLYKQSDVMLQKLLSVSKSIVAECGADVLADPSIIGVT